MMLLAAIQERPVNLDYVKELIKTATIDEKGKCLEYVVRNKSFALLRALTQNGIDINQPDFSGQTPLHHAVLGGNADFVKKVLELGANQEIRDLQFERPLDIALREKNIEVVKALKKDLSLTAESIKKMPGYGMIDDVSYAQNKINDNLLKFLEMLGITEGTPRDIFMSKDGNCNGWAFLYQYYDGLEGDYNGLESEEEFWDILKCISRWDPKRQPEPYDVRLSDMKDIPPKLAQKYRTLGKLMYATINDLVWFQQAQALKVDTGISQSQRMIQWEAIKRSDEKVQLKNIFNLKAPSIEKKEIQSMLEYARRWPGSWIDIGIYAKDDVHQITGHAISIRVTSDGKFKFYDSNRQKRLPPIASSEVVSRFISNALRKESVISNFNLFRFYPSEEKVPEYVAPLTPVDNDHYATPSGKALLCYAAMSGELILAKNILKEGGLKFLIEQDKEVVNYLSRLAIIKDDKELKNLLKEHGVALTHKMYVDSARKALSQGEVRSLIGILENGELKSEYVDARNESDLAALHLAINQNDKESVMDLLRLGANKELSYEHETPLYQAVRLGHKSIAKILIRSKAELDCQKEGYKEDAGFTPLHIAMKQGHVKMVELLLLSGANIGLKDKEGRTAFEIEPLAHKEEIGRLIEQFEAGNLTKEKRKAPLLSKKEKAQSVVQEEQKTSTTIDPSKKSEPGF